MQQKSSKPRKRVSFANHAMVTEFETEEPTQKVQFNPATEAALSGSYLQDSPNSYLSNPSNASPIPSAIVGKTRQNRLPSIASSIGTQEDNDDDILNQYVIDPSHHQHQQQQHQVYPNHNDMEIECNDDNQSEEMELTGTLSYNPSANPMQHHRPSTTPQMQGIHDLLAEEDTENIDYNPLPPHPDTLDIHHQHTEQQKETLQDLFNTEDTITSIPMVPPFDDTQSPPKQRKISTEARSFNLDKSHQHHQEIIHHDDNNRHQPFHTETAHLQQEDDKQSTTEFTYHTNNNQQQLAMHPMNNNIDESMNNGSFQDLNGDIDHDMNHNQMPALESPMQSERDMNVNQDVNNKQSLFDDAIFASPTDNNTMNVNVNQSDLTDIQPTGVVTYQLQQDNNALFMESLTEEDDHTLHIDIPAHLANTPLSKKQQREFNRRRSSMTNQHQQQMVTPPTVRLPDIMESMESSSNLNSSMLSDTTNIGSATKAFRVDVHQMKIDQNTEQLNLQKQQQLEDVMNGGDNDGDNAEEQHNTSLTTMMDQVGNLIQEKYQLVQQNQEANPEELRIMMPDTEQIREQQDKYQYQVEDNDVPMNGDQNVNDVDDNDEEEIEWREIAKKFEWFPTVKTMPKYSFGIGMKPISKEFNKIMTDPQEIILQEICDKVKYDALERLSERINVDIDGVKERVKVLEAKLDENCKDNPLIQRIRKYGGNEMNRNEIMTKCAKLKELCMVKCDTIFLQKKLQCQEQINQQMEENYGKLAGDLEDLKRIYAELNGQCMEQQETINKLREYETNQSLRNLQKKIFENEEKIEIAQSRNQRYNQMMNEQKLQRETLENNIKVYTEKLNDLEDDIQHSNNIEIEMEEIASTIWFLNGVTGVRIKTMTSSKIELILMKWVCFGMNYDYQTKKVFNVEFKKHPSPKLKDEFSPYLINMLHSIGGKLEIFTKIKTISDLKAMFWKIVELINGIFELRVSINKITKNPILRGQYKVVLNPLNIERENINNEAISLQLSISRMIEYDDDNNEDINRFKMQSHLLIDTIITFRLGYPFNKIEPKICVVLMRKLYDDNCQTFKPLKNRIDQMLIEQKLCKLIEDKLRKIKVGSNLFIRCFNMIGKEMEDILQNEANGRHQPQIYD